MAAHPIADVQTWVDGLDVPPPPDFQTIDEFLDSLAQSRGRPIRVLAWPMPPTKVCGLWIGRQDGDTIVVADQLSGVQRDHAVMHEAAHILLNHHGINRHIADQIQDCLEQAGGAADVESILGRCRRYDDDRERSAELLASYYQAGTLGMQRRSWIHRPQARRAAAALFGRTRP